MAYLSPFVNDIFISYARIDDETPPDGGRGWVTYFEEQLRYRLRRQFVRADEITIWRDTREVPGNAYFDSHIKQSINQSALFIALLSEGYIAQEGYCHKELDWFYKRATRDPYGLTNGPRSRLFNVRLQNIPPKQWPEELSGMSGFKFHDDRPVSQPIPPGPLLNAQIDELFTEVVLTMRAFKALIEQKQKEEAPRERRRVFVGCAEGRMRDVRRGIVEELTKADVSVVTNIPPPRPAAEHEQAVVKELAAADLAVHILDDAPGEEVEDAPDKFYSWEQVELGLRHAKSQLIWVPDTVDIQTIENAGHKGFLQALEKRTLGQGADEREDAQKIQAAYSFVREPKTELARVVLDKLDELAREKEAAAKKESEVRRDGEDEPESDPVALVDTHQKDAELTAVLGPIFARNGLELRLTPEGDGPRSNTRRFENSLKQASVFLVVFGAVAPEWVFGRLTLAQNIIVREKCDIKLCGVYMPPGDAGGRQFRPPPRPPGSPPIARILGPEYLTVLLQSLVGAII